MSGNKELTVCTLTKSYNGKQVLNGLNYTFSTGKIYLIRGKNGCGKTTFLRIVSGLERPDSGYVKIDDLNCAYVFQEHRLFPWISALENAAITEKTSGYAETLLKYFGFSDDDMKKLPSEISGGMRQTVAITRAVVSDREILLLDEPTKELDKTVTDKFFALLRKIKDEKIIIMVSHSESDTEIADEIIDFTSDAHI